MNMNYLLAGTVSLNLILFIVELLLILAWKTAGWWGLDRWVLALFGTPWSPGLIFHHDAGGGQGVVQQQPGASQA